MNISTLNSQWRNRLIQMTPGQLVIQFTDQCNATCPQCSMRISSKFDRKTLSPEEIFKNIEAAAKKGIKAISFTGGEPFLHTDDLCRYIRYAGGKKIPFIRTGTNGFQFMGSHRKGFADKVSRLADKLSKTPVRNFWISLDSCDPAYHEKMRGFDRVVEGISKAIPIFEDHGIFPSVNLGINRNLGGDLTNHLFSEDFSDSKEYEKALYHAYIKAFSEFYETVIQMGFTIANACYPMSVDDDNHTLDPVYQASATDRVIRFAPVEKKMIFKALRDTIPKFRGRIRIFSPRTTLHTMVQDLNGETPISYPCQGGLNYFFIDAQSGNTYPCGYRGNDNFGKFYSSEFQLNSSRVDCRECDWECFRDPSELTGPFIDFFSAPHRIFQRTLKDSRLIKFWIEDLFYYHACGYFNGRKAPSFARMKRFAS